jgi:REP element-mobilizing transposase RayT
MIGKIMPRQPRIDLPGQLYHLIARGIERRKIFRDERDYESFLTRLEECLKKTGAKCMAYSLLGNHFHLLILRGERPLAELMRRLMTGYAVRFNLRHRRAGHLFQNRYKAILCEFDAYLLELVAYIHLNPLRAGIVEDLVSLRKYRWCGHGAIMGEWEAPFLSQDDILAHFGKQIKKARRRYESFIRERVGKYKKGELSGGGLKRSRGGTWVRDPLKDGEKESWDERILGDGDFVDSVLRVEGRDGKEARMFFSEAVKFVKGKTGVGLEVIRSRSRVREVVKARGLYCYLAKEKGGVTGAQLMKELSLSSGAISHLVSLGSKVYSQIK